MIIFLKVRAYLKHYNIKSQYKVEMLLKILKKVCLLLVPINRVSHDWSILLCPKFGGGRGKEGIPQALGVPISVWIELLKECPHTDIYKKEV